MKLAILALGAVAAAAVSAARDPSQGSFPAVAPRAPEPSNAAAATTTLTGRVAGFACLLGAAPKSESEHRCSATCLRGGMGAAIVDEARGVFHLAYERDFRTSGERFARSAGERVRVAGRATEGRGLRVLLVEALSSTSTPPPRETAWPIPEKPRDGTIVGFVVNIACAVTAADRTDRFFCSGKCLADEAPMGLLEETTGTLYLAFTPPDEKGARRGAHALLRPLAAGRVEAKGRIYGNGIEVSRASTR